MIPPITLLIQNSQRRKLFQETSSEYEDYIVKTYAELDAQKCKDAPTTLGTLFLPVIQKAMGDKEWTEENLLKVFNELEESSGQIKTFEITAGRGTARSGPPVRWGRGTDSITDVREISFSFPVR